MPDSDTASARTAFGRGVAMVAAGSWAEQVISLSTFFLLARLLPPDAFGLMAMATAFVVLAEFLVRETLSDLVIAEHDPDPDYLDAVFWSLAGLGLLLSGGLTALAGPIARLYDEPAVRPMVLALSPVVLTIALTAVPVALLRRSLRFGTLSSRAATGVVVGGVVGLALALSGWGIWSLVAQRVVQVGAQSGLVWAAAGWRPRLNVPGARMLGLGRQGSQMIGFRAAELSALQLPAVLIGATLGPGPLGYFAVAWKLVEAGSFLLVTPLCLAALPTFAALRRDAARPDALLLDLMRLTGFVAIPAFAGLAALAVPILLLLAGPNWPPAAPVLAILSLFGAYLCIAKVEQTFCIAYGRPGLLSAVAWTEVILASLAIWLVAAETLVAMVGTLVLVFGLLWPLRSYVTAELAGVRIGMLLGPHVRPALASALMAGVVSVAARQLELMPLGLRLPIAIALGIAVYAGLSFLFMRDRFGLLRDFLGHERPTGPTRLLSEPE